MLVQKKQLEAIRNWARSANNPSIESLCLDLRLDFLWHMSADKREDSHLYLVITDEEALLLQSWFIAYRSEGYYNRIDEQTYHLIREHERNGGDPSPQAFEADDYPNDSWKTYKVTYFLPLQVQDKKTAVRLAINEWERVRSNLQVVIEEKHSRTAASAMQTSAIMLEQLKTMMDWFNVIRRNCVEDIITADRELYAVCQKWAEQADRQDPHAALSITYTRDMIRLLQRWYLTYKEIDVLTRRDQQALAWIQEALETTTIIYEVDVQAESKQDVLTFLQEEWNDVVGSIRVNITS